MRYKNVWILNTDCREQYTPLEYRSVNLERKKELLVVLGKNMKIYYEKTRI